MKRYDVLGIDRLVSDVAVDTIHVRELADSIKVSGPIAPVLVREENLALIDGFHRVAAMRELGFDRVESIILDCNEETFWDMRITAASTHKSVTFARVVDWIDEVFKLSPQMRRFSGSYKSAFSLFDVVSGGTAPDEVKAWAQNKAQQWGLSVSTIRQWLYTRQTLAPDLLEEAKKASYQTEGGNVGFTHYFRVGQTLSGKPDLQKQVIEKAKQEGLTSEQTQEVARAIRQAPDFEEQRAILARPVTRTADDLARDAKVQKLLNEPKIRLAPKERQRQLSGLALEVYLDLQQQIHNVKRLTPQHLNTLSLEQRAEFLGVVNSLLGELHDLADALGDSTEIPHVIEGKVV